MPTVIRRAVAAPFRIIGVAPPLFSGVFVFAFLCGAAMDSVLAAVLAALAGFGVAAWASHREPHVDILIGEWLRQRTPMVGRAIRGFPPAQTVRIWSGRSNRYGP